MRGMEWIRDNTLAFVFILIFGVTVIMLVVSSVITFVVQNHIQNKRESFRSYNIGCEVDLRNNRAICFERKDCSKRRVISLEVFYQMLHKKDVLRVKLWFEDIRRNYDFAEKYIETEVVNRHSEGFFLLLKTTYYDEANQIVYLEGHQLSRMNPSQGRKRASNNEYSLIKRSQIESVYESLKKKCGFVYSIRFYIKNNDVINDATIERSVLYRLKNEVYSLASNDKKDRYVYDDYDDQIFLFDFKIEDEFQAKQFAEEICKEIAAFLKIKAFVTTYGVAVGAVSLATPAKEFTDLINKASSTSEACRVNELPYLITDDETENLQSFDNNLVEKVFHRDSLRLLYRPIINIKTEQIVGYFGNVKCLDTHFENYFEIARYVNKVDRNEELLSKVIQHFVSKFYFERPNNKARLFVQVSLVDLDHLGNVLSNIAHSQEANLVLLFEESEVNANAFSLDLLTTQLNELISLGYEIALLLKDENTLLENSFYSVFNYFIIGSAMVSKIKDSSRVRLSNKFLIETLLQYKRPIIINDLDGWSSIDLFVKSGCTFLSGDDISPSSEMILPIEKQKIARLRKINN